jgi:hypothetical protein
MKLGGCEVSQDPQVRSGCIGKVMLPEDIEALWDP